MNSHAPAAAKRAYAQYRREWRCDWHIEQGYISLRCVLCQPAWAYARLSWWRKLMLWLT